jgi:hypothetical protein
VGGALLLAGLLGCGHDAVLTSTSSPATATAAEHHPVTIRQPPVPRGVVTGRIDPQGQPIVLICRDCHSTRPADLTVQRASALDEFHQGLHVAHGQLRCVSCHNPSDHYASLRLADGRSLPFAESMQLCAQCHGTQFRDYQHGAHGGMTGHWDLTRGGRTRNHCLHCHDPHVPRFPVFQPAPPPRDRFAPTTAGEPHE